jgi:stage II sporulation protein D
MKPCHLIPALALLLASRLSAPAQALNPAQPTPHPPDSTPDTRHPIPHTPSTLRIGLWTLWHDKQLTLAPTDPRPPARPQTRDPRPETRSTLRLCPACTPVPLTRPTLIKASSATILIPNHAPVSSITVSGPITLSAHDETITLRHPLSISARNGQLVLAVTLPLESYVERVVSSESGPATVSESLKALAIVVRSFALHQPHGHADYDLCDSTHCQLLHWSGALSPSAHAATLATAGETLWYHGRPAAAFFHQDCGGRTATPSELWPSRAGKGSSLRGNNPSPIPLTPPLSDPMPWLVSRADPYCTANGVRSWSADISLADLTTALSAAGLVRPGWRTLTVARHGDPALGQSPRPITLRAGSTEISAEDFRLAVGRTFGWGHILSTWFEITPQGDHFLFSGRGSGHGVGLCQHGAAVMAAQGRSASEILAQYFPGAESLDESTAHPWQSLAVPGVGHSLTLETLDPAASSYLPTLAQALAEAQSRSGLQLPGLKPLPRSPFAPTPPPRPFALPRSPPAGSPPSLRATSSPRSRSPPSHPAISFCPPSATSSSTPCSRPTPPPPPRSGSAKASSKFFPIRPPLQHSPKRPPPRIPLAQLDSLLAHPTSESQSAAAHRAAAIYAARLIARYGRTQVLTWVATHLFPPTSTCAERVICRLANLLTR